MHFCNTCKNYVPNFHEFCEFTKFTKFMKNVHKKMGKFTKFMKKIHKENGEFTKFTSGMNFVNFRKSQNSQATLNQPTLAIAAVSDKKFEVRHSPQKRHQQQKRMDFWGLHTPRIRFCRGIFVNCVWRPLIWKQFEPILLLDKFFLEYINFEAKRPTYTCQIWTLFELVARKKKVLKIDCAPKEKLGTFFCWCLLAFFWEECQLYFGL